MTLSRWPSCLGLWLTCLLHFYTALAATQQLLPAEDLDSDHTGLEQPSALDYSSTTAIVVEARSLLDGIQPPRQPSLVRLTKTKGVLGSAVGYAQSAFNLLFLNGPRELQPSAGTATPAKLNTNLVRALKLLEQAAASKQNPDALWLLAELNFHGNHTHPRNYTAAFSHYNELAHLTGNASAHHMLGFMYATGIGGAVDKDQARALLYHTFAADAGDVRSQMVVGYRHHTGIGTPRNCATAVKYYKQAARTSMEFYKSGPPGGHVLTKNAYRLVDEVGGLYGEGASVSSSGINAKQGGPTSDAYADIEDVLEYLDFQSRKGDLRASFNLAKLYYDGSRGMERDMKAAKRLFMQIARMFWSPRGKVVTDASKIVEKLAPRAAGNLGRMFLRGEGMEQSFERAMIWFKRGIEYGDVLSQYSVGVMYMHGLGVPKDTLRAASYLGPAADNDLAVAQTDLGVLFLDQGDVHTARSYFELAIQAGHIEAYYYLAELADQGLGRDKSCSVAATFYKITTEKAEVTNAAFIEANEAYEHGDTQKALVAYMMAAEQGYEIAQANVAWILDQSQSPYTLAQLSSALVAKARKLLATLLPAYLQWSAEAAASASKIGSGLASSASDAALSLIYYTRSAKQSNLDSLIKTGDHHLSGLGTTPSAEAAAACYSAAADTNRLSRSAQGMWNLGWMHEVGIGVEKDYHLAKRYYDLAASTNKEAWMPVKLSLLRLRVRSWWNGVSGGQVRGIQPGDDNGDDDDGNSGARSPSRRRRRGFWEWVNEFIDADLAANDAANAANGDNMLFEDDDWADDARSLQRHQDERERGAAAVPPGGGGGGGAGFEGNDFPGAEYLVDELDLLDDGLLESLGIIALAALLAALVYWRQQRVRRANEAREAERRRGGQGQLQEPIVGQGQVFPAPDDPDFVPWAAGGIGH